MAYNKEIFVKKAKAVHGEKYDYSLVEYRNSQEKVCIICPKHGVFLQTPGNHLQGHGCPKCACEEQHLLQKSNNENFIRKAKLIHGDKYDYSKVEYVNNSKKVCIICPEHGEFWQTPGNHISGQGCPKCGKASMAGKQIKGLEHFIIQANAVHGNKYDYSKVEYNGANKKVCIVCPEHGEFWQTPSAHINGRQGCPLCGRRTSNEAKMLTKEGFIARAQKIHGEKYGYEEVEYDGYDKAITIICPEHGKFQQTPDSHLQGHGCPKCSNSISEKENEIFEFCLLFDPIARQRDRNVIPPYEIDIFLPSFNVAIEYNGLLWHSEKYKKDKSYHLMKLEMCKEKGVKLIQIFEDEYINNKEIVLSKIKHIIGADNLPKIMGRKCTISNIPAKSAKEFLNKNHIQGFAPSSIYLGAFFENNIVAVMSFKEVIRGSCKWELTRFASDLNYVCQGVGGKLFKHFVRNYNPIEVKSFADRRWTVNEKNNLYVALGFKFEKCTKPDYKYYKVNDGYKRIHKFNLRKKVLSKKSDFPSEATELKMANELGYLRIFDCGLIKYIWKKEK